MTQRPDERGTPILAEDLLLLLFQPDSGTIAGETTLFSVLAGAVLADLALEERVRTTTTRTGIVRVRASQERAPSVAGTLSSQDVRAVLVDGEEPAPAGLRVRPSSRKLVARRGARGFRDLTSSRPGRVLRRVGAPGARSSVSPRQQPATRSGCSAG